MRIQRKLGVIPAKAGIHLAILIIRVFLDSRLRGNDILLIGNYYVMNKDNNWFFAVRKNGENSRGQ